MAICAADLSLWKLTGTVENARRHRVAALLYLLSPDEMSDMVRSEIQKDYLKTTAENLFFLRETKKVLEVLNCAGLPAIPLKGVLFALRFYEDIGSRPQSDVDILVREEDLMEAHSALIESGWQEAFPRAYYEGHYHWVYRGEANSCLLELHWRLKLPGTCAPEMKRVWKNAKTMEVQGIRFLTMSPEDLLEYMAVNKAKQHYSMLLDFVDLSQIVMRVPINWELLLENALLDRTSGALWFGLTYARRLLGACIPERVLNVLARRPEALGARALARMLNQRGGPLAVSPSLLDGPAGRIYEAMLEGRPSAVWNLFKPLLFPNDGRLRLLAGGSYSRYWRNHLSHLRGQLRAAISR